MPSYLDPGAANRRAIAALCTIDLISNAVHIPAEVRLVMIAERMAQEPILTDDGVGAHHARRAARRYSIADTYKPAETA